MKNVKITLKTTQLSDDQCEQSAFSYSGRYDEKNGSRYIMYDEENGATRTVVKADNKSVHISRSGETQSRMKVVAGAEFDTVYTTPHTSFTMTVSGISVDNRLDKGYLAFEYVLKTKFGEIGRNKIEITLEEV